MNNGEISQIKERLQRIDNSEVNFNWHNWSSSDIRILLAEIDRLTSTCVECEDCILQAGEISQ